MDESESDLDDHPFADNGTSSRPTTTADGELSYESDEPDSPSGLLGDTKASHIATPPKPGGRAVRRSSRKPVPIIAPKQIIKSAVKVNKRPSLFSIDKLLKEKKRKADDGYDLRTARNQLALEEDEVMDRVGLVFNRLHWFQSLHFLTLLVLSF